MGRTTSSPKLIMSITTVAAILTILASTCMARNLLTNGEGLYAGQSLDVEQYKFIMQDDCNLVLYEYSTPIWASNTGVTDKNGCRAVMQKDGNFVVYDVNGRPVWATNSVRGNGNYILVLQEDSNVVIYGSDIWSTGTYRRSVGGAVVMAMNGTVGGGSVVRPVTGIRMQPADEQKVGTGAA
uniref:Mannose-binding plant lectin n=1 Tax=Allium sativum TaxID=4682 RepID=A0A3G6IQZ3_ALLSA|nr:mannose-binding plant lectin [Allium sativum]